MENFYLKTKDKDFPMDTKRSVGKPFITLKEPDSINL